MNLPCVASGRFFIIKIQTEPLPLSDATWQKNEGEYAGQNLRSRSSNGLERPFPKLSQRFFEFFCFHCLSHILIGFIGGFLVL
jgi:hypothetical protein